MSRLRTDSGILVFEVVTGVLNASCHSCSVFGGHHEGVGVTSNFGGYHY